MRVEKGSKKGQLGGVCALGNGCGYFICQLVQQQANQFFTTPQQQGVIQNILHQGAQFCVVLVQNFDFFMAGNHTAVWLAPNDGLGRGFFAHMGCGRCWCEAGALGQKVVNAVDNAQMQLLAIRRFAAD